MLIHKKYLQNRLIQLTLIESDDFKIYNFLRDKSKKSKKKRIPRKIYFGKLKFAKMFVNIFFKRKQRNLS